MKRIVSFVVVLAALFAADINPVEAQAVRPRRPAPATPAVSPATQPVQPEPTAPAAPAAEPNAPDAAEPTIPAEKPSSPASGPTSPATTSPVPAAPAAEDKSADQKALEEDGTEPTAAPAARSELDKAEEPAAPAEPAKIDLNLTQEINQFDGNGVPVTVGRALRWSYNGGTYAETAMIGVAVVRRWIIITFTVLIVVGLVLVWNGIMNRSLLSRLTARLNQLMARVEELAEDKKDSDGRNRGEHGGPGNAVMIALCAILLPAMASAQTVRAINPDGLYQGFISEDNTPLRMTMDRAIEVKSISFVDENGGAAAGITFELTVPKGTMLQGKLTVADTVAVGIYRPVLTLTNGKVLDPAAVELFVFSADQALLAYYQGQRLEREIGQVRSAGDPLARHYLQERFQQIYGREDGNRRYLAYANRPSHAGAGELLQAADSRFSTRVEVLQDLQRLEGRIANAASAARSAANAAVGASDLASAQIIRLDRRIDNTDAAVTLIGEEVVAGLADKVEKVRPRRNPWTLGITTRGDQDQADRIAETERRIRAVLAALAAEEEEGGDN